MHIYVCCACVRVRVSVCVCVHVNVCVYEGTKLYVILMVVLFLQIVGCKVFASSITVALP